MKGKAPLRRFHINRTCSKKEQKICWGPGGCQGRYASDLSFVDGAGKERLHYSLLGNLPPVPSLPLFFKRKSTFKIINKQNNGTNRFRKDLIKTLLK